MSMLPRAGFASDVCEGSVDLYGEFADTDRPQLTYRPLLDSHHPHTRAVHHIHAHIVNHDISFRSQSAHHDQPAFAVDSPVDSIHVWTGGASTSLGGCQMARHRPMVHSGSAWNLRVWHERLHSRQSSLSDTCGYPSLGTGRGRSEQLGLFLVSNLGRPGHCSADQLLEYKTYTLSWPWYVFASMKHIDFTRPIIR